MVCGNFILPEPASYVFFYAFFNLRKLLYIIQKSCKIITERPSGAASDCKSSAVTDSSLDAKIHKDRRSKHISLPASEKVWRIYARYGGIIAERYKQSFYGRLCLEKQKHAHQSSYVT